MKKMNKPIYGIIGIIILLLIVFFTVKEFQVSDAEKFAKEYNTVTNDNVFVYRNLNEINNILEHGTGIVYLGFPDCPWCQEYIKYLNEEAKKYNVEKIYYFNILEDRQNNTEGYKKIVSIIKNYLQYDEEGNKRIYVPAVIAVYKGEIVGFDDETAWDTKDYETPQEYWKNEDLNALRKKFIKMFQDTKLNMCTSDCN